MQGKRQLEKSNKRIGYPKEAAGLVMSTEPERDRAKMQPEGKNTPVGVYLTRSQRAKLNKIAVETGVTIHALLKFAPARFLADYDAGKVVLHTETKKTLKMPGE